MHHMRGENHLQPGMVDERCLPPIREAVWVLGNKWSMLVLAHLSISPHRFNQLRRKLSGVSTKALTDTLRHLERHEIVERKVFPTVPVTVEYSLTEKGKDFQSVLIEMYHWGKIWEKRGHENDQDQ
jgi:DNA-binding HxlR family transcriptional regulator